jgi:hypothetical protein
MKADNDIYCILGRYVFATPEQILRALDMMQSPRLPDTLKKRLTALTNAGLLGRKRKGLVYPYLYWLKLEGAKKAHALGAMQNIRVVHEKSESQIEHEIGITDFMLAIDEEAVKVGDG